MSILLVFVGAGIGGVMRHLLNLAVLRLTGPAFPWGTALINVSGSFVMGLLIGFLMLKEAAWLQNLRLFVATGILGGYTTFSTFSLEAVLLWQRGEPVAAAGYVLGSVVVGIVGLLGGLALMRSFA